ncbi:hypothetical protein Poly59_12220 [Rubripirellula reticaptiva]|uniref:Uncharacterized protein n=1 Tax=Rubripirellula reticaptiva TaxID=2528013 RepID=A0A5C6FFE9_9BACT|nr:hypothetical protein Poly59_12220 [Rubripirellula reticaptiva]
MRNEREILLDSVVQKPPRANFPALVLTNSRVVVTFAMIFRDDWRKPVVEEAKESIPFLILHFRLTDSPNKFGLAKLHATAFDQCLRPTTQQPGTQCGDVFKLDAETIGLVQKICRVLLR